MNEHVFIVLWRLNGGKWHYAGMADNVQDRDLLMGFIRLDHHFDGFEYAWVEGPLTNVTEMAAAEQSLGAF